MHVMLQALGPVGAEVASNTRESSSRTVRDEWDTTTMISRAIDVSPGSAANGRGLASQASRATNFVPIVGRRLGSVAPEHDAVVVVICG